MRSNSYTGPTEVNKFSFQYLMYCNRIFVDAPRSVLVEEEHMICVCVANERLTPTYQVTNSWQKASQRMRIVAWYQFDKYRSFEVNSLNALRTNSVIVFCNNRNMTFWVPHTSSFKITTNFEITRFCYAANESGYTKEPGARAQECSQWKFIVPKIYIKLAVPNFENNQSDLLAFAEY